LQDRKIFFHNWNICHNCHNVRPQNTLAQLEHLSPEPQLSHCKTAKYSLATGTFIITIPSIYTMSCLICNILRNLYRIPIHSLGVRRCKNIPCTQSVFLDKPFPICYVCLRL
jgi:hypothetical protein